jgi:endo-1,4-beta-xylanase
MKSMHLTSVTFTYTTVTMLPALVLGQLNDLAKQRGKLYFGTETETWEFNDTEYLSHLNDVHEVGQSVPGNSMKVCQDMARSHVDTRANGGLSG